MSLKSVSFSIQKYSLSLLVFSFAFLSFPTEALAHVSINTAPTTSCGSLDSLDLTTHTGNQIDTRIVGKSPSTDYKLFSTTGTTASSTWVRNTGVWTNTGTDLDWTGISPWNSQESNRRTATLISPRHVMMASHYIINPGSKLTFVDNNNVGYERTISAVSSVSGTDISIGLLDSDVPDTVTYYPIMSTTDIESTLKKYSPMVYDVPIIAFDQDKNAIIRSFHNISSGIIFHHSYTSGSRANFSQDIVSGDSGNPAFLIIDNQPVLLFGHESGGAGPNYGYYISNINTAMSSLGGGYQVSQYSPTCFNTYTPNNYPSFTNTNATSTLVHYSSNTPILTYSATDADSSQILRFNINGLYSASNPALSLNASDYFTLSSSTGVLTQIADINNYTLGNILHLSVSVSDNGTSVATTTATTTINISYPVLSGALVLDSLIELDYDRNIATSSVPSTSDFSVQVNGVSRSVSSVSILDDKVRLALSSTVVNGDVTTLTYTPGTNKIKDTNGSYASAISSALTIPVSTDGTLNTSFDPGTGFDSSVSRVIPQADGKIIVYGAFKNYNGTSTPDIVRLNPDGSVDSTFRSRFSTSTASGIDFVQLQADGKLLVAGTISSYDGTTTPTVIRLNTDGSRDTTYNFPLFYYSTTDNNEAKVTYLQSDQKMVVVFAGNPQYQNLTSLTSKFVRFNTDGTIDSSFAPGTGPSSSTVRITRQSDGKYILVGAFTSYSGTSKNRIVRTNSDGTIDSTFTIGTGFSASTSSLSAVLVQPDGKILVGGSFSLYNGTARNKILRLNSDGTIDTGFVTTGTGFGASTSTVTGLALQDDGKIIVVGNYTTYNGTTRNRISRLNTDGSLDATFDPLTGADSTISTAVADQYGNMYVTGTLTTYGGVSRTRIALVNASTTADVNPPTITNVTSSSSNGTYKLGDTVSIQVAFDEAVTVNTTGGTPTLTLNTGTTSTSAIYTSGSGTNTLNFTYTVASGDFSTDLDYASSTALSLNGGTITDSSLSSSYNASLALPEPGSTGSLSNNSAIVVDGIKPEIFISSIDGSNLSLIYTLGYSQLLNSTDLLDTSSVPSASDFTVKYDSVTIPVSSVSISDYEINLGLSLAAEAGRQVTISYNSSSQSIKDLAGNTADSLTSYDVHNNTAEVSVSTNTQTTNYPTGATAGGGNPVPFFIDNTHQNNQPNNQSGVTSISTANTKFITKSIPTNFNFNKNLDINSKNSADVKILQRFLNENGFTVTKSGAGSFGKETTSFGPATKAAIVKFQKVMGIQPASGYFGPVTRGVVNKILKDSKK